MSFSPELSIIVYTIDHFQTVQALLQTLHQQTDRERCELVLGCPALADLHPDESLLQGYGSVKVVEVGHVDSRGAGLAQCLRAATSPIAAFTEDHCLPEPGWITAQIEEHQGPYAAVCATLLNGNPATDISWCDILVGHGAIVAPATPGERPWLGGHNVSYKREILLKELDEHLHEMLDTEVLYQQILHARGYRLLLSGKVRARHFNFETYRGWLPSQYYHGRLFGAVRWRNWSWGQRIKFLLGTPLSPFMRLLRMARAGSAPGSEFHRVPRLSLLLLPGLLSSILGEITGCLFGMGNARQQLVQYEFKRWRFFREKKDQYR